VTIRNPYDYQKSPKTPRSFILSSVAHCSIEPYFFLFPTCVNIAFSKGNNPLSDWEVAIGAVGVVEDVEIAMVGLEVSNLYLKCVEGDVEKDPVVRKLKVICDRKNRNGH
jgi:hypothetical protein